VVTLLMDLMGEFDVGCSLGHSSASLESRAWGTVLSPLG
jgi:hypothetical protein